MDCDTETTENKEEGMKKRFNKDLDLSNRSGPIAEVVFFDFFPGVNARSKDSRESSALDQQNKRGRNTEKQIFFQ